MAKNVVLCCDGTANEFARDKTNVVKLFSTLIQDPARQVAYYHPGLGTMEPPGALTPLARKVTKLFGKAFGYGLPADIRDAVVFLMNHYQEDDKLFLFGFSRGAYTVRAVASVLHMYGLIRQGNEPLVPYAIRLLTSVAKTASAGREGYGPFALARDFTATFATRDCHPWFVGVWDTVSSVGWFENPLHLPFTANNPDIRIGRHAVSIDERRAFFRANLWRAAEPPAPSGPKDVKQVWFPGVHCDVGGGYAENESQLSRVALAWMLHEAEAAGLLIDKRKEAAVLGEATHGAAPSSPPPTHESLTGWWRLAEFVWKKHYDWKAKKIRRRMNLFRPRTIPMGSLIHESALQRGEDYKRKFAKQLPKGAVCVKTDPALPYFEVRAGQLASE